MILPSFHPHSIPSPAPSIPLPFHLPHPQQQTYRNHPCYCVTVLLRPFVSPLIPHTPPSFSSLMSPPFPSPPYPFPSRPFIFSLSPVRFRSNIYTFSHARPPSPSQPYFAPFRTRNAKNRLLASGITLIFIVPNSIQLGMRQEVTRYRCWKGAAVGSSESDNTPPTRTFQRKIRRVEE